MPYIKAEDRGQFDNAVDDIVDCILAETSETSRAGMLNFVLSSIIADLLEVEGLTYDRINKYIGVLECAKLELYRRIATPYEMTKKEQNGDVYRV